MDYVARVVDVAISQIGVAETPGVQNWGPKVSEYIAALGFHFPVSWCAGFARWCMLDAARRCGLTVHGLVAPQVPILRYLPPADFGYCPNLGRYGAEHEILFPTPQVGDLMLLSNGRRFHHTGLVVATAVGVAMTCEGNTNSDGSADGYEVCRKTRAVGPHVSFLRWAKELQLAPPAADGFSLFLNQALLGPLTLAEGHTYFPVRPWAKALGFDCAFDAETQTVALDGQLLDADLLPMYGELWAPVRALSAAAGLTVAVDAVARRVTVSRV